MNTMQRICRSGMWTTSSFWWWLPKRHTRWSATNCPPARLTRVLMARLAS
jgi:hypothetical protein